MPIDENKGFDIETTHGTFGQAIADELLDDRLSFPLDI